MVQLSEWHTLLIPALILCHLAVAPYTKVEESFNIQAIHDVLRYGIPVSHPAAKLKALFDHATFPGSVPRTFVGALVTAALSKPLIWVGQLEGLQAQLAVRSVLGLLSAAALTAYIGSIRKAYGNRSALWYTFFQASQFHVFYYASRTLPNTFAFCLSTFASRSFIPDPTISSGSRIGRLRRAFYILTLATVIFRSELALLMAAHATYELLKSESLGNAYTVLRRAILPAGAIAGCVGLIFSMPIDTYLWQSDRFILPELEAFLFNIFPKDHQGASAWGTSPWHWYFTSAIPRLIWPPFLLLIPYGIVLTTQRRAVVDAAVPALTYTLIYSILPHKETRFLFPIVPSLTLAAAIPASYLSLRRDKLSKLLIVILSLTVAFAAFISHVVLLPLSAQNYPGGQAMQAVHSYYNSNFEVIETGVHTQIHVHLTNLALQSGVTRFLEQPATSASDPSSITATAPLWIYDKTPLTNTSMHKPYLFWSGFDFVVVEPKSAIQLAATDIFDPVLSIPSLRTSRPRILKPFDRRGCLTLACRDNHPDSNSQPATTTTLSTPISNDDGLFALFQSMYGIRIANLYGLVHDVLREGCGTSLSLTGGYWIDWGLEERLVVLKNKDMVIL